VSLVAKHGIKNDEQLAHAGGKGRLGMFAPGAQPQVEGSDGRIAADCRDRRHVEVEISSPANRAGNFSCTPRVYCAVMRPCESAGEKIPQ